MCSTVNTEAKINKISALRECPVFCMRHVHTQFPKSLPTKNVCKFSI